MFIKLASAKSRKIKIYIEFQFIGILIKFNFKFHVPVLIYYTMRCVMNVRHSCMDVLLPERPWWKIINILNYEVVALSRRV